VEEQQVHMKVKDHQVLEELVEELIALQMLPEVMEQTTQVVEVVEQALLLEQVELEVVVLLL
jgi:uncharacterized protein YabN with tetrapyrrole methylase and pyrophosphatase domain